MLPDAGLTFLCSYPAKSILALPFFHPDINECATRQHDCDKNAKCVNTPTGYECKCRRGFEEYDNGRKCRGMFSLGILVLYPSSYSCILFSP